MLERTYRQRKSLKLQQLIAQRQARVEELLSEPDGWRQVLSQLLADALDRNVLIGQEGILELSLEPAPRYAVAGEEGIEYRLTTQPLRGVRLPGRKEQVVPLDATLHPAARMEAQMLWEHLAGGQANGSLPRQAAWFLEVHHRNRSSFA